jgi:UDP-N-acetylmuramyl pentapeptide phosphotransferase/UDP-N-acetylglucosamine-1-phosphate transferase
VAIQIVIGVVVLALLIYRQLRTRPVNASGLRIVAIIGAIGLIETYQFLQHHHAGAVTYAALLGSLALAAGFGVPRAATVRIWLQDGQPWSRGSWITAGLWIVALAVHPGLRRPGRRARPGQRGCRHHRARPGGEPRYPAGDRATAC